MRTLCGVFLIGYLLGSWVVKMIFWSPQVGEGLVLYVAASFQQVLCTGDESYLAQTPLHLT